MNVRSVRWPGNGRDGLGEVEAPTMGRVGRVGGCVERGAGRRVCRPRCFGAGARPSLQCDAQPGSDAVVRLGGLALCPESRSSKLPCGSLDGTRKPSSARMRHGTAGGAKRSTAMPKPLRRVSAAPRPGGGQTPPAGPVCGWR